VAESLGLIETRGLVSATCAADAMLKAAAVELVRLHRIDPALVTVVVRGDTASTRAAVDAGAEAAARVGELVSAHVIAAPDAGANDIATTAMPRSNRPTRRS
jgi:ethanolamine utilization protein EutM